MGQSITSYNFPVMWDPGLNATATTAEALHLLDCSLIEMPARGLTHPNHHSTMYGVSSAFHTPYISTISTISTIYASVSLKN
jgi:hypothetical protein